MMTPSDPVTEASARIARGDLDGAIAALQDLLRPLFEQAKGLPLHADNRDDVIDAAQDLTDLLRWDRRFDEAIALQHQLARILPDIAQDYRILSATLKVEAGRVDAGLAQLTAEAATMDHGAGHLVLGSMHAWLVDHASAELHLSAVTTNPNSSLADRAAAQDLRFSLFAMQNKMPEAARAWEAARMIDGNRGARLPDLVRKFIYWYQYDAAASYLSADPIEIRRTFYTTLIATRSAAPNGRKDWTWVSDYDPDTLTDGHEEYAEAAMRSARPEAALDVLMPRLERLGVACRPMVLAGLAFAQERDVARARWALDQALRLADLDRPRRTRAGAGSDRIFDAETRITYGEIPIDPDIRAHIDIYFMPRRQLH